MMSYLEGEVDFKVYYNEKTGYGVYKVLVEDTNEPYFALNKYATITGTFIPLEVNANYKFEGKISFNNKYGYSFVVDRAERILPTSIEGLIEYLSGDSFIGIGKGTATKVVNSLGIDTIELILNDRKVLDKVEGINEKKKDTIYNTLVNNRDLSNTLVTLYSYGISPKISMRIYDKFNTKSIDIIKADPYVLIDEIEGIAFIKADQIALKTGINAKSPSRISACIVYTLLNNASNTGDTYLIEDKLITQVREYLGFNRADEELIKKSIEDLLFIKKIYRYEDGYILAKLSDAEEYVAKKLTKMNKVHTKKYTMEEIEFYLKNLEKTLDIEYEDDQKEAILNAINNNVSIITGGPGTGKTTIERGIIYVYSNLYPEYSNLVRLAAPTGKAAKRIEESTYREAKTIHKLLGYDKLGKFFYNKFNILPVKMLIIDEASMIDTYLFKNLLEALEVDTKLVIVGDSDQLPSIGPGQVLKDLIDSGCFSTTKLNKIHRQKENSKIISLAYDVLSGTVTTEIDEDHDELVYIKSRQEDLFSILKNTIDKYSGLGYDIYNDIQILIPIYKGGVGIEAVNRYMQMNYNPNYKVEDGDSIGQFYIDDKVIQLINQYEDGVMNGDMGIVEDTLGKREVVVDFQGLDVSYKGEDLSNISLAYAISIHKSQGSEFKVVIIPFFNNYRVLLNKKLVYTAITRAKEHLVIIGDNRCFNDAITINSADRLTTIKKYL
ncbi:MAG: ATP-dependent RecD-like DNA helicase [Gammaproteobacteria bacterium]|nr:ATP-dependent RecD-like DNA helicase [Gammaproteobacteria bacterium]